MTADFLREAATTLRTLAEDASPGPWAHETASGGRHDIVADDGTFVCELEDGYYDNGLYGYDVPATSDAAYIAAMHPGVGLLLAHWLDSHARDLASAGDHLPSCDSPGDVQHALAVARAVLGRES